MTRVAFLLFVAFAACERTPTTASSVPGWNETQVPCHAREYSPDILGYVHRRPFVVCDDGRVFVWR